METANSASDSAICHAGGNCAANRKAMVMGEVGGNIEIRIDQIEFGLPMMYTNIPKLSHTGTAASGAYCCNSCSVSQVAANPAKNAL